MLNLWLAGAVAAAHPITVRPNANVLIGGIYIARIAPTTDIFFSVRVWILPDVVTTLTDLSATRATLPPLQHRERWFIRALIHVKYKQERRSICVQQVKLLASCAEFGTSAAPRPILFTLFDFAFAPPVLEIHKLDPGEPSHLEPELPQASLLDLQSTEWKNLVSRADTDRGYMQLHGMRLVDDGGARILVIPLRTNSAAVYEGLVGLADRMRAGEVTEEEMMSDVDALLAGNADVLEIH
ncbi:hypothetical protein FB45DRAFT_1035891 [Roridomyces roridus]|uniref:Uncharacterized protein n=1 Tax=Roridomyces roridus TaxID=1738132 RepID=A0AAD7FBP5_9AGAR|nr:hypothetical protein FB45DRAFT_1035891 [Roridomyces roridus]